MQVQINALVWTLMGCAVFMVGTMALQRWYGVKLGWQPLVAGLRATLQLAALSLILAGVFQVGWTAFLFVALMITVASVTSARRVGDLPWGRCAAPIAIASTAVLVITMVFLLRMLDFSTSNLIAVGGIVTGNCMSAATLTGRRFGQEARSSRGQVEGWFALGATPAIAYREVARQSITEMLIPKLDQTKNTGLVTLPGAFVGALMGGAVPVQAARFQLVVLISIMFAQTLVGIIETRILSRATTVPADPQRVESKEPDKKPLLTRHWKK